MYSIKSIRRYSHEYITYEKITNYTCTSSARLRILAYQDRNYFRPPSSYRWSRPNFFAYSSLINERDTIAINTTNISYSDYLKIKILFRFDVVREIMSNYH